MKRRIIPPIDPVGDTVARLAAVGQFSVEPDLVSEAWRDVLYPELEDRVGSLLTARLPTSQLSEFMALLDAGEEDAAKTWFEANVPEYRAVVRDEFDRLLEEAVEWFLRSWPLQAEGGDR